MEPMIALGPFVRVIHQLLHAFLVHVTLFWGEWTAIDQQRFGKRAFFGFDYVAVLGTTIVLAMQMVSPMRVVFAFAVQLILYGFAHQLVGILGKARSGLQCA